MKTTGARNAIAVAIRRLCSRRETRKRAGATARGTFAALDGVRDGGHRAAPE
jgi:hypothetical protein